MNFLSTFVICSKLAFLVIFKVTYSQNYKCITCTFNSNVKRGTQLRYFTQLILKGAVERQLSFLVIFNQCMIYHHVYITASSKASALPLDHGDY